MQEVEYITVVVPAARRASVLPDLPTEDLSTELLAKGGAPLPIESKKELSSFRYSIAPENSLKQEARQTFAMLSNRTYQSLKAFLISHKAFLNNVDPSNQQKVQSLQVTQHSWTEETCKETSAELESTPGVSPQPEMLDMTYVTS